MNATPPTSDSPAGARAHVASLQNRRGGDRVPLSPEQARHLTRSRRLPEGAAVTAFDDAGRSAAGHLRQGDGGAWSVELAEDPAAEADAASLTVYAAVPKGGRADWMVEKLGELGTSRFVPILCERGVVEPGGGKLDRFARLAREAAKQSRRPGVMQIGPLTPLADALAQIRNDAVPAAVLATETRGRSLLDVDAAAVFVGPEGGWTPGELAAFADAGVPAATLGDTILRVETAAVCAAAIVSARTAARRMSAHE